MTDIRIVAQANKAISDTVDCEHVAVAGFLATFQPEMSDRRRREVLDAVRGASVGGNHDPVRAWKETPDRDTMD